MQNSGTKLVLALVALALALGATSWWSRYQAAHRVTQLWGPEASRLIAESENFHAITYHPTLTDIPADPTSESLGEVTDLTKARGQAHLRHAFMSDSNYLWDRPLDATNTKWRWALQFHEPDRQAVVLISEDLTVVGKQLSEDGTVSAYSCVPMTTSLKAYFQALGLLDEHESSASTAAE